MPVGLSIGCSGGACFFEEGLREINDHTCFAITDYYKRQNKKSEFDVLSFIEIDKEEGLKLFEFIFLHVEAPPIDELHLYTLRIFPDKGFYDSFDLICVN